MKIKQLLTLALVLISHLSFAQTATDVNGNKVYNGNSIAIFTKVTKFTVGGIVDIAKVLPGTLEEDLRISLNTMATSAAQNQGLQVVNRDNESFRKTQQWLDESKNEEYIDGLSVRAKSIGATHLLVQDVTFYTYGNAYIVLEIMNDVISVQTNISKRNIRRYRISMTNSVVDIKRMIAQEKSSIRKYFMDAFPGLFVLQNNGGNIATLAPTSAFGIDSPDKIFFYRWENIRLPFCGKLVDFSKMELLSVGSDPRVSNGYLQVKLNKKLAPINNLVIKLGDVLHSECMTYHHIPLAFMNLKLSGGNMTDDYCKKQINNAVYNALYDYPCINLIESEELSLVKSERELQKTEEFMDGFVVEQFKASGAKYILNITDYSQKDQYIRLKLSVLNVSTGAIEKDFLIECHISNIDKVIEYYINQIFISPIAIGNYSNKQIKVYPLLPIATNEGEEFSILYNKPLTNPLTGQTSYNRIEIAKCTLTQWNVQEYVMTISQIISKEDFETIGNVKIDGLFYLQKNIPEPQRIMVDNTEINWK